MNHLLDLEIRQLRREHDAIRLEYESIKREYYGRKYDPNQPRVPAGEAGGGQWMREGDSPSSVQPIFHDPRRLAVRKAIEAGLAFYTWLSARNGRDGQAIITFNASEFKPDGRGELDLSDVKLLDRDKVDAACPRLGEVQERTYVAADAIRHSARYLPPASSSAKSGPGDDNGCASQAGGAAAAAAKFRSRAGWQDCRHQAGAPHPTRNLYRSHVRPPDLQADLGRRLPVRASPDLVVQLGRTGL